MNVSRFPHRLWNILDPTVPRFRRNSRVVDRCVTVEDLRDNARRRWPRVVRDYVEGGAEGEIALRRNYQAFEAVELTHSVLRDVSDVDLRYDLLGFPSRLPIALAPTGYSRVIHRDGEVGAARAAQAAGIPYTLSTMSTTRIEDLPAPEGACNWFQLYVWKNRTVTVELLRRADQAGYRALFVTVDAPVTGLRTRDLRNRFKLPPRMGARSFFDVLVHPPWLFDYVSGPPITFANFPPGVSGQAMTTEEFARQAFDASLCWRDLDFIRSEWKGPLVVKGIAAPSDALRARDCGADGIVVSNHGGRQLEQAISPLRALGAVRAAVGDDMPVLIDSGIRRGVDVAAALALGASGCLIGRAYLYGLGAAGEVGCSAAIRMLGDELRRSMQLLGVTSIAELRAGGPDLCWLPDLRPSGAPRQGEDGHGRARQ